MAKSRRREATIRILAGLVVALLLASCMSTGVEFDPASPGDSWFSSGSTGGSIRSTERAASIANPVIGRTPVAISDWAAPAPTVGARQSNGGDGDVTLDFKEVDVQVFVRTVFEEIVRSNVAVDPGLTGRITVRTPRPIRRDEVIPYVRSILAMQGATLSQRGSLYSVSPANAGPSPANTFEVVRLSYASAKDLEASVKSAGGGQVQVYAGSDERTLIIGGQPAAIGAMSSLIASLDVDELAGRSFTLQPLKQAGAGAVARELQAMFGKTVRVLPLPRINAVLLIGQDKSAITRALSWAVRLDSGIDASRKVYVYPVQNRRAVDLEKILAGIVVGSEGQRGQDEPIAPAFTPAIAGANGNTGNDPFGKSGAWSQFETATATPKAPVEQSSGSARQTGGESTNRATIRADIGTNSLVIATRPEDWPTIEATIRRLDILPRQVLVEVMIVEVSLNDALRHGVRWFIQHGNHGAILANDSSLTPAAGEGFNYVFEAGNSKLVVNALEKITNVQVISSPALTVLDNQTAKLKVGDEVPIITSQATAVATANPAIVSQIEMRQTGIVLSVTPRVNASGLVLLDVVQEASDVAVTTTSTLNSPTIRNRAINSTVSVTSGTEIVLGGLITNRKDRSKEGIPLLQSVPILGNAFTSDAQDKMARTELMIIMRPTVLNDMSDVRALTNDIRDKLATRRKP